MFDRTRLFGISQRKLTTLSFMKKDGVFQRSIPVAMAIIYQDNKYLMQLRDDFPNIVHPGVWGFFGGHLEPEEDPETGLKRELIEEIDYSVEQLTKFCCHIDGGVIRHIFSCALTVPLEQLELKEGWDMGLLSLSDIQRGYGYSLKAKAAKPIGAIHRQILLDFLAIAN